MYALLIRQSVEMGPATVEPAAITVSATKGSPTTATKSLHALVRTRQLLTTFTTETVLVL